MDETEKAFTEHVNSDCQACVDEFVLHIWRAGAAWRAERDAGIVKQHRDGCVEYHCCGEECDELLRADAKENG